MLQYFTDANFLQEVIEASKERPVLVDFFASWCAPCKVQGPIIEEVAEETGEKATVGKLDVDNNQQTAGQYEIMSIPNMLIFKNGKVVENLVGLQDKQSLLAILKKHL
jgi:thioredoxin 1